MSPCLSVQWMSTQLPSLGFSEGSYLCEIGTGSDLDYCSRCQMALLKMSLWLVCRCPHPLVLGFTESIFLLFLWKCRSHYQVNACEFRVCLQEGQAGLSSNLCLFPSALKHSFYRFKIGLFYERIELNLSAILWIMIFSMIGAVFQI